MRALFENLLNNELPFELNDPIEAKRKGRKRNAGLVAQNRNISSIQRNSSAFEYSMTEKNVFTVSNVITAKILATIDDIAQEQFKVLLLLAREKYKVRIKLLLVCVYKLSDYAYTDLCLYSEEY